MILVTLLGQGLTLPLLLHKLQLPAANRWDPDEAMVRLEAAQAALDRRDELREHGAMRRELISTERAALLNLRNAGTVRADVIRRVQRDLDLEEARIRG